MEHRRARGWLLLALALLVLSLGPFLVWTNDPGALVADPPRLPAWWVEKLLPPLRFIWGWCRLGILVATPLAMAAAFAVARALGRWPALRPQVLVILLAGLAVDHAHERAPAGISGFAFDPRPPPELVEALSALPPGAIVQLPFDDFYMTWQLAHGRPIAESLEIEDIRQRSYLVQHAEALVDAVQAGEDPPFRLDDPRVLACLRADARRLAGDGWAGVVLHRDRLPDAHLALTRLLTAALGLPARDGERVGAWVLRGAPLPAGMDFARDCPVEKVEAIIPGASPGALPPEAAKPTEAGPG